VTPTFKKLLLWGTAAFLLAFSVGCTTLSQPSDTTTGSSSPSTSVPSSSPPTTSPSSVPRQVPSPVSSIHLTLENPSNAAATDPNNYLMVKPQYALSYNNSKGIPNWVSWQLNENWLGSVDRDDKFRPDPTL
jgi:endonuclease G